MLTSDSTYGYTESLKITGGIRPCKLGVFFMPKSRGIRTVNILNSGQRPVTFSESPTFSFIRWLLKITGVNMSNSLSVYNFNENQIRTQFIWERPNSKLGCEAGVRKTSISFIAAVKNYLDKESQFLYFTIKRLKPLNRTFEPALAWLLFMPCLWRECVNKLNKHTSLRLTVSNSRRLGLLGLLKQGIVK